MYWCEKKKLFLNSSGVVYRFDSNNMLSSVGSKSSLLKRTFCKAVTGKYIYIFVVDLWVCGYGSLTVKSHRSSTRKCQNKLCTLKGHCKCQPLALSDLLLNVIQTYCSAMSFAAWKKCSFGYAHLIPVSQRIPDLTQKK